MTPLIVAFISYTFFALEALGSEIEDPFSASTPTTSRWTRCRG
jgi:putative membrane protein